MLLELRRIQLNPDSTEGELWIDGEFECYTLEDAVRPEKIKGKTAIPAGRYRAIVNMSARFKRMMILLLNVPNFEGVRMHAGNTVADTEGCPLLGDDRTTLRDGVIGRSRAAATRVTAMVQAAISQGQEVWCEVTDPVEQMDRAA